MLVISGVARCSYSAPGSAAYVNPLMGQRGGLILLRCSESNWKSTPMQFVVHLAQNLIVYKN
jgi:hypothetical protein